MKKCRYLLIVFSLCFVLTGCGNNSGKNISNTNKDSSSYLKCVYKDNSDWLFKSIIKFDEKDKFEEINISATVNWSDRYAGDTNQVYKTASDAMKEYFDYQFKGINYDYKFNNEGTAQASFTLTRKQIEEQNLDIVDYNEVYKLEYTKEQIEREGESNNYYCTDSNDDNWDIIPFNLDNDNFIEYYLDYIDESLGYDTIRYFWYALDNNLNITYVMYHIDEWDGYEFKYYVGDDEYYVTLDQEIERVKAGNPHDVEDPTKYLTWLLKMKDKFSNNSNGTWQETSKENINRPLFYDKSNNKTVLSDGNFTDENYNVPILVNQVPNNLYKELIKKVNLVDQQVLNKISEIKYVQSGTDEEKFLLTMTDGNYVYVTISKFEIINQYIEIIKNFDNRKGTLYLDSGTMFFRDSE